MFFKKEQPLLFSFPSVFASFIHHSRRSMTATSPSNAKKQSKIPRKAASSTTSGSSVCYRLCKTATIAAPIKNEFKIPITARKSKNPESSVFDRLHKTSTISSRTRKVIEPTIPQNILTRDVKNQQAENLAPKLQTRSRNKPHDPRPVFDRLYKQGTFSSKSKRKNAFLSRNNL